MPLITLNRTAENPARPGRGRAVLGQRTALAVLASAAMTLLVSSSAPTPLYETYQARWGFSDLTVTVIFGVYAIAVLVSLLSFGSLSDHIGRRPPLIFGLSAQALVMLVFAFAGGLETLLLARVLQGIATGLALGAIGAGMVDLDAEHGPLANSASMMAGTATGSLLAALFVQFLPAPTELVYLFLAGVFLVQALAVFWIAETSPRRPGALAALVPTLRLPRHVRGAVLVAAPALIAVWAVAGFYASLGPALAEHVANDNSMLIGGASLFVLAAAGALAVVVLHRMEARRLALLGSLLTIVGSALLLLGVETRSLAVFALGTVVTGSGVGGGFQGGLRTIVSHAAPTERAGVVSVVYVILYLSLGASAIVAGLLAVNSTLTSAADELSLAVIVLAALTSVGLAWMLRREGQARRSSFVRGCATLEAS